MEKKKWPDTGSYMYYLEFEGDFNCLEKKNKTLKNLFSSNNKRG